MLPGGPVRSAKNFVEAAHTALHGRGECLRYRACPGKRGNRRYGTARGLPAPVSDICGATAAAYVPEPEVRFDLTGRVTTCKNLKVTEFSPSDAAATVYGLTELAG